MTTEREEIAFEIPGNKILVTKPKRHTIDVSNGNSIEQHQAIIQMLEYSSWLYELESLLKKPNSGPLFEKLFSFSDIGATRKRQAREFQRTSVETRNENRSPFEDFIVEMATHLLSIKEWKRSTLAEKIAHTKTKELLELDPNEQRKLKSSKEQLESLHNAVLYVLKKHNIAGK